MKTILTLRDLQQPFQIETDSSYYAIGVVFTKEGHRMAYHYETLLDTVWKYPRLTTNHCTDHYAQLIWQRDFGVPTYLQELSRIRRHRLDTPGRKESSKFSPLGCTVMPHWTHVCSFK